MPLEKGVDLEQLASQTNGFSGADLYALCRESALIALSNDFSARVVNMANFSQALQTLRPSLAGYLPKFLQAKVFQ